MTPWRWQNGPGCDLLKNETPVSALAAWIACEHRRAGVRLVGINGAQGSGKTTLARRLATQLDIGHDLQIAMLGLDDLYLTRAARRPLAAEVHPLLATRGVPGTHDVTLGLSLLAHLRDLRSGVSLRIPRFIKALDDRAPPAQWRTITGPVDLVLFEGWCVGTLAQAESLLQPALNDLEANEDADGRWRRWVNAQLAGPYQPLFAPLQRLIFLQAPDFDCVLDWRLQQERGDNLQDATQGSRLMDESSLRRFIAHYERLTRHALATLPQTADVVVELTWQRGVRALRFKESGPANCG